MVVDVLEDGDALGSGQHLGGVGQRPPVGGGQDAPVDGEAGHRPQRRLVGHQHRSVEAAELARQRLEADGIDEDRPEPPARRQQPREGVGALGHEEAGVAVVRSLHQPPGPGVVQLAVVVDPPVVGIGDGDGLHPAALDDPERFGGVALAPAEGPDHGGVAVADAGHLDQGGDDQAGGGGRTAAAGRRRD